MDKKSNNPDIRHAQLPDKPTPASPVERVNDDVAWVLEHVSSPFRWELLEVPPVLAISTASDKFNHRKLRLTR